MIDSHSNMHCSQIWFIPIEISEPRYQHILDIIKNLQTTIRIINQK